MEVLRIRRERGGAQPGLAREARETLDELNPEEVFDKRLASEELDDDLRRGLQGLHREVLAELREEPA
ncbi:Nuclease SbcCD subunit D [compost metagenome]